MNSATKLLLAVLPLAMLGLPAAAAAKNPSPENAKTITVIDFTTGWAPENRKDVVDFAYDQWNKKIEKLGRQGTIVPALPSRGGFGANGLDLDFRGSTAADLSLAVLGANTAGMVVFSLRDADGTECSWNLPLAHLAPRKTVTYRLEFDRPDSVANEGKVGGLDGRRVVGYQIRGDWSDSILHAIFVRVGTP